MYCKRGGSARDKPAWVSSEACLTLLHRVDCHTNRPMRPEFSALIFVQSNYFCILYDNRIEYQGILADKPLCKRLDQYRRLQRYQRVPGRAGRLEPGATEKIAALHWRQGWWQDIRLQATPAAPSLSCPASASTAIRWWLIRTNPATLVPGWPAIR